MYNKGLRVNPGLKVHIVLIRGAEELGMVSISLTEGMCKALQTTLHRLSTCKL